MSPPNTMPISPRNLKQIGWKTWLKWPKSRQNERVYVNNVAKSLRQDGFIP